MRFCFVPSIILFATFASALRNPVTEVGGEEPAEAPIGPPPRLFPWGYSEQVLADPPSEEHVAGIGGIDSNDEVSAELRRAAVSMMRYFHELGVVRLEGRDIRVEAGLDPLEEQHVTEEDVNGSGDSGQGSSAYDSGERQGEEDESDSSNGEEGDRKNDEGSIAGSEGSHAEFGPDQDEYRLSEGTIGERNEVSDENAEEVALAEVTAPMDRPTRVGGVMAVPLRFRLAPNMTMDDVPRRLRRIRAPLDPVDGSEGRRARAVPELARGSNGKWFVCGRSPL